MPPVVQKHPDHPKVEPKPGDTIVWRRDGSNDPLPEVEHTGSCHCSCDMPEGLGMKEQAVDIDGQRARCASVSPTQSLAQQEGWHFPVKNCDCSICQRNGYLTIFAERKDIEWLSGWDEMQFATEKKVHRFCGTCGSSVCIDFLGEWKAAGDVLGINARMLDNLDIEALYLHKKDGKNFVPGS